MNCQYLGICGSCTLYDLEYKAQLELKKSKISELFSLPFELYESPSFGYRSRAEFSILYSGGFYAMRDFGKKLLPIESCEIVAPSIKRAMQELKDAVVGSFLQERLFGVEFLSSNLDGMVVTLIFKKQLDERLVSEAKKLSQALNSNITLRARNQKIVIGSECIADELIVGERLFRLQKCEGSFSQPNTQINQKMINWACDVSKSFGGDLLELYCGSGNFTIPLSFNFEKVLATEVTKSQMGVAAQNAINNGAENISFARLSSSETASALASKRQFFRLKGIDIKAFNFSTIFLDPPRSGLDVDTLEFARKFQHIIYISCNPLSLKRDYDMLKQTHKMGRLALFDQFPNSGHIESGAVLRRR